MKYQETWFYRKKLFERVYKSFKDFDIILQSHILYNNFFSFFIYFKLFPTIQIERKCI